MLMIRVCSTRIPAARATSISWPTARMSCPSFVFLNQRMKTLSSAMTRKVPTGIGTPPIRIIKKLSNDLRMPIRFTVFRIPYPRGSNRFGEMILINGPIP